jgi:hypothetical protein
MMNGRRTHVCVARRSCGPTDSPLTHDDRIPLLAKSGKRSSLSSRDGSHAQRGVWRGDGTVPATFDSKAHGLVGLHVMYLPLD